MRLTSDDLVDGTQIPEEFCLGVMDRAEHVRFGKNHNPHLAWRDAPRATRSYVVICHDPDVPSVGDDVNREDREVSADLRRVDFYHWVLFDIPSTLSEIPSGAHARGVTPRGKDGPSAGLGMRHGLNDYTSWFADDPHMAGKYYGYDGPCPPWNDSRLHHYIFTAFALDVEKVCYEGEPTGANVRAAMAGHVLDRASLVMTYTLNPRLANAMVGARKERMGGRVPGTMVGI